MDLAAHLVLRLEEAGVRRGETCGVAVSGGADSTALLHALVPADLELHLLHVDHRLRPSSGSDADAVRELANGFGLPCTVLLGDLPDGRVSPEEAARTLRYRLLDEAADRFGLAWVATGHTRDDQAETVLLRLLRGTGTTGLAGIPPVRGRYVRPLLDVSRAQLRAWLTDRGLAWREDPSNVDQAIERNWVRHTLVPLLESRRQGAAEVLARHARLAASDEALLDGLASELLATARSAPGVTMVDASCLAGPRPVTSRAVRRALARIGGRVDAATIERVLGLARAGAGAVVCGPHASVRRVGDHIAFVDARVAAPAPLDLPGHGVVEAPGWGIRLRVGPDEAEPWTWRCRLDTVRSGLKLRARRPGDRVPTPAGTRKVQDVLVDAKVPRVLRDRVAVLVDGDGPVAVVGLTAPPWSSSRPVVVDAEPTGADWWTSSQPVTS